MNFVQRIAIVSLATALPLAVYSQDKGACAPKDGAVKVKLTTSMGPITLALDAAKAPITTENFARYVGSGFYNGTIFHRVIDGFMIQGGGIAKAMIQKPISPPIKKVT